MVTDAELGTIEFIRSDRAKHIRVRILSTGLKVSLPHHSTQDEALKFIQSVRSKIIQKQEKLDKGLKRTHILIDKDCKLKTLTFAVEVHESNRKTIFFSLKEDLLRIEFPEGLDCSESKNQEHFWNGISYFLRKEAKRVLPERTKTLADKYGFRFTSVKIQSSKSRWGSCSQSKSVNFSLYMMLLPAHLVDYVILHELCHTKEMNHGANFWMWMDKVTDGKSKSLRAELKKYHMPN